jgi:hypothetical protein
MTWKVIHSSAIGNSHLRKKKPCQDYVSYCKFLDGHLVIGVVADGSSSAKHSDKGAEIAVKCTIHYLQHRLNISKLQCQIKDQDTANIFFIELLKIVQKNLENQANNNSYSLKDFACTLLVFIAHPDWLAAMQVGDGLIVVRQNNCDTYQLLFKPDKGEFINYTTFVTSSNARDKMQIFYQTINLDFIFAATDWCENIAVTQLSNWKPLTDFFQPLENCVLTNEREIGKTQIDTFLNSERVNKETDDDKTLLLCVWDDSPPDQPKAPQETEPVAVGNDNIYGAENHEQQAKDGIWSGKKRERIKNLVLLISLGLNLVAVMGILIIANQFKQPVPMSYSINTIDRRPTPINLKTPISSISIDVWVLTSLPSLDKKKKTITTDEQSPTFIYSLADEPSKISRVQLPIGFLPSGTYPYVEAKIVKDPYWDSSSEKKQRWVKLKMNLSN